MPNPKAGAECGMQSARLRAKRECSAMPAAAAAPGRTWYGPGRLCEGVVSLGTADSTEKAQGCGEQSRICIPWKKPWDVDCQTEPARVAVVADNERRRRSEDKVSYASTQVETVREESAVERRMAQRVAGRHGSTSMHWNSPGI